MRQRFGISLRLKIMPGEFIKTFVSRLFGRRLVRGLLEQPRALLRLARSQQAAALKQVHAITRFIHLRQSPRRLFVPVALVRRFRSEKLEILLEARKTRALGKSLTGRRKRLRVAGTALNTVQIRELQRRAAPSVRQCVPLVVNLPE